MFCCWDMFLYCFCFFVRVCVCLFNAGTPLHWIYDREKLVGLTEEKQCVVFYPQAMNPYYVVPTGSNSAYGDQVYVTLKSVVDNGGKLEGQSAHVWLLGK